MSARLCQSARLVVAAVSAAQKTMVLRSVTGVARKSLKVVGVLMKLPPLTRSCWNHETAADAVLLVNSWEPVFLHTDNSFTMRPVTLQVLITLA